MSLVASIRRVADIATPPDYADPREKAPVTPPPPEREGKIIAVFSPKGGVGRTTVACNLAVALTGSKNKRPVVLVDGCLRFGDVGMMLGVRSEHTIANLAHLQPDDIDARMLNSVVAQHKSGIRIMLAPPRPDNSGLIAPATLRHILEELRLTNDFVVVDVSSALDETDLTILDVADKVIVLFTLEMTSLKSIKLFTELAHTLGYQSDKLVMVANRVDEAGGVRLADVEENLGFQTAVCIRNDPKVTTLALNKGVPFVLSHRQTSVAQSIEELAVLLQRDGEAASGASAKGDRGKGDNPKKEGGFRLVSPESATRKPLPDPPFQFELKLTRPAREH